MSSDYQNPYAAPRAPGGLGAEAPAGLNLASRLTRLGARLIDTLIGLAAVVPVMIATGYLERAMQNQIGIGEVLLYTIGGLAFYLLVHGYLLATRGQTVGKMLLGVRIVDYQSGQLLPFIKLVGLRDLPIWIVASIPLVGGILSLIDILFIFSAEQRCVHDLIAGTKVVKA